MQTILGAGGPVGDALAQALKDYTNHIRLVSRNPEKADPNNEVFKANLLKLEEVLQAVEGSKVVYLTAGLEYNHKIWQRDWPVIVENVITACEKKNAALIFFDNVYMYSKEEIPHMTESSKIDPPSRKGKVRADIAGKIMKRAQKGSLQALIARSADFYGPHCSENSLLIETVFKPLSKGKKASWLGGADNLHSFTYVPDAAKATALLGNSKETYGQLWHLPTAGAMTGKEWIEMIGRELHTETKYREVPKWMIRLMGLFMPVMRETVEMFYQYDRDYRFDSSKFEKTFGIKPTPPQKAIKEIVAVDFQDLNIS